MSVKGFFAGILGAIGILMALLSGGCILIFSLFFILPSGRVDDLFGIFIMGGVPFVTGLVFIFAARALGKNAPAGIEPHKFFGVPRALIVYFVSTGLLSLFVMASPDMIIFGFFAFIVPGLVLMIMPMLFAYPAVFCTLSILFKPLGTARFVFAALIIGGVAFVVPYYLNSKLYEDIDVLVKDDKEMPESPKLAGSIALIDPVPHRKSVTLCEKACQNLLFNGVVKNVFAAQLDEFEIGKINEYQVMRFYIEERPQCPEVRGVPKPIEFRISKGFCLLGDNASLTDTNMIYVTQKPRNDKIGNTQDLWSVGIRAEQKALYVRDDGQEDFERGFQKTQIEAYALMYPWVYGGVTRGGMQFSIGFWRDKIRLNDFGYNYKEDKRILGEEAFVLKPLIPTETLNTVYQLSKKSGVRVKELGEWTRAGLLEIVEYSEKGYALYSDDMLLRIKFIKKFQEKGGNLEGLKGLYPKKRKAQE